MTSTSEVLQQAAELTPERIEELKRVAEDAARELPGTWEVDVEDESKAPGDVGIRDEDGIVRCFAHCSGGCMEWITASEHIATFDPPTVLALLARVEELEGALEPFAGAAEYLHPLNPDDGVTCDGIEVRHWRRARAAILSHRPSASTIPNTEGGGA